MVMPMMMLQNIRVSSEWPHHNDDDDDDEDEDDDNGDANDDAPKYSCESRMA